MLSREIACTIFQVFGMTRPGIEPRFTAYKGSILPLGNDLRDEPILCDIYEEEEEEEEEEEDMCYVVPIRFQPGVILQKRRFSSESQKD